MSTTVKPKEIKEVLELWDKCTLNKDGGKACCNYNGLFIQFEEPNKVVVAGNLPKTLAAQFIKNNCATELSTTNRYLFNDKLELEKFLVAYDRHKNKYQQILKLWGTTSSGVVVDGVNLQNYNGLYIHIDEYGVVSVFGKLPDALADKYKDNKYDSKLLSIDCYLFENALELAKFLLAYDEYKDNLIIREVISGDYSLPKSELTETEIKQLSLLAELNSKYNELYPNEARGGDMDNDEEKTEFIEWCKDRRKGCISLDNRSFLSLIIQAFENKKSRTAKKNIIKLLELGEIKQQLDFNGNVVPMSAEIQNEQSVFGVSSIAQLKSLGETILPFIIFDSSFGKKDELGQNLNRFNKFLENVSIQVNKQAEGVLEMVITMNGTGNKIVYRNAKGHISLTSTFDSEQECLTLCHFYDETSENEMVRGMGYFIECSNKETEYDKRFFARFTCNFNKHSVKVENLLNPKETQIIDYINVSDQERWATTQSFMIGKIVDIVERVNQLVITGNTKGTR